MTPKRFLLTLFALSGALHSPPLPVLFAGDQGYREIAEKHFSVPDTFDIEYPDDLEPSEEVVELGSMLFFDNRLSFNESQSCATCHNPDHGLSDGIRFSLGATGKPVERNTPHLYNLAWNQVFFWDGRAASLEEQALAPIEAEAEMNMPIDILVDRLKSISGYREVFEKAYGDDSITPDRIAAALASFQREIIVDNTPFDSYLNGNDNAISLAAKRGMALFVDKAACIKCHDGANFTDNSFHNIGLKSEDIGRKAIVDIPILNKAFKVPGLRNILFSAPYMHDGSIGTLEEVVRFYNRGGDDTENISSLIKPLHLNEDEIRDLVAFLGAINKPLEIPRPNLPEPNSIKFVTKK